MKKVIGIIIVLGVLCCVAVAMSTQPHDSLWDYVGRDVTVWPVSGAGYMHPHLKIKGKMVKILTEWIVIEHRNSWFWIRMDNIAIIECKR